MFNNHIYTWHSVARLEKIKTRQLAELDRLEKLMSQYKEQQESIKKKLYSNKQYSLSNRYQIVFVRTTLATARIFQVFFDQFISKLFNCMYTLLFFAFYLASAIACELQWTSAL